jgi:hypothetical protein
MNSIRHGAYARGDVAIPRGPFSEDPDELEATLGSIAGSLRPRDAIERHQARRVAGIYVKLRRLDEFEAHALARDTSAHPHLVTLDRIAEASWHDAQLAGSLAEALFADEGPGERMWQPFAPFILRVANGGEQVWCRDLWMKDREPDDDDEWRRVVRMLAQHLFDDLERAASWAKQVYAAKTAEYNAAQSELMELAAHRALSETLKTTVTMSGRLSRQLRQELDTYHRLAERVLADTEHRAADDPEARHGDDPHDGHEPQDPQGAYDAQGGDQPPSDAVGDTPASNA